MRHELMVHVDTPIPPGRVALWSNGRYVVTRRRGDWWRMMSVTRDPEIMAFAQMAGYRRVPFSYDIRVDQWAYTWWPVQWAWALVFAVRRANWLVLIGLYRANWLRTKPGYILRWRDFGWRR